MTLEGWIAYKPSRRNMASMSSLALSFHRVRAFTFSVSTLLKLESSSLADTWVSSEFGAPPPPLNLQAKASAIYFEAFEHKGE
jgi:hypothetical protein